MEDLSPFLVYFHRALSCTSHLSNIVLYCQHFLCVLSRLRRLPSPFFSPRFLEQFCHLFSHRCSCPLFSGPRICVPHLLVGEKLGSSSIRTVSCVYNAKVDSNCSETLSLFTNRRPYSHFMSNPLNVLITTLPVLHCLHSVQHLQLRCLEESFLPFQTRKNKKR